MRYQNLATEYLRIVGENYWLRNQLRASGIEIAPLPDDLRPITDAAGNISIFIARDRHGGVTVTGGKVDIAGDAVSGDEVMGREKKP